MMSRYLPSLSRLRSTHLDTARSEFSATTIEFRDIVRQFGSVTAVDGVTFSVAAGSVVCLLGHSGCGKTTLLRIAAGVDFPTSGEVVMNGSLVAGPATFVPAEQRRVGLVFQDHALFPHMTVLENAAFGLSRECEQLALARSMLSRVGLEHYASAYPAALSGGEQQRLALVRALVTRPGLLLMDEPFSSLDERLRDEVRRDTMSVLREQGTTVIVVTHDPEEALRIADRIILMRAGRVVQDGSPRDLADRPTSIFAARFFSHHNEIPAKVSGGTAETPLGPFPAPNVPDGAAVVCVRPASIELKRSAPSSSSLLGRVLTATFLGDTTELTVSLPEFEAPLIVRLWARDTPDVGADVYLEFRRLEANVYPASASEWHS